MPKDRHRPSNFVLVHSEHAHESYPGHFFSPALAQPLYGAGRKESSGTGLVVRTRASYADSQLTTHWICLQ